MNARKRPADGELRPRLRPGMCAHEIPLGYCNYCTPVEPPRPPPRPKGRRIRVGGPR